MSSGVLQTCQDPQISRKTKLLETSVFRKEKMFDGYVDLSKHYAQTLIVVVLIVVNFFVFLVIAPCPTMRF